MAAEGRVSHEDGGSDEVGSYLPVLGAYVALVGSLTYLVRRSGRRITVPRVGDVLLLGLATFKLSRLITKEKALQPIREPFTGRMAPADGSEVSVELTGTGLRRAAGELLTCPFCISVWIATLITALFAIAPRAARITASGLAAVAVADASQYAYAGLRKASS